MASRPPTEQQVVLDADGRPVMTAMDAIVAKIGTIQKSVGEIMVTAKAGSREFDNALSLTLQRLRTAMGELRTMQSPGTNIQILNNDRGLARATLQATDYARGLAHARDTAEALRGKINDLNREIAGRGANGQGATIAQRDRLATYEKQLAALKALDVQQERNDRRAARTRDVDLSAQRRAVDEARARLQTAAMDPNRTGMVREIKAAQLAQDQFTEALNRTRAAQAALVREQQRAQSALVTRNVRDMVANGSVSSVRAGLLFERELASNRLAQAVATKPQDLSAAREALALAERRVRAIESIVRQTEREVETLQRRNRLEEMANARITGRSRREVAVADAAALREINAIEAARIQQNLRLADLRNRLKIATIEEARVIFEEIQLEKAVGAELQRNLNLRKAAAREQERANRPLPGGGNGPFLGGQFGLPAGGLGTVVARTAAYGAAGMAIFGVISAAREGVQFVTQFEDSLKRLQAISASTETVLGELSGKIGNVGEGSRFSLIELTEMATKLAQAGVSAAQMGEALESVARLATASGSTPQESVDLITAALGSFQLAASETPRIADMITTALNRTRLTVQQSALAIQYVGATAYEQNISLEQLLSTAAALSQAGIRSGSTIGTGMRQFLVDLQRPSEKLTEQLKGLNLSMADVDVTTRGLPAVLQTLNNAGFGAAQAYGSLETRAAAFYLTARNNTDLMQELTMQFANQGAAAIANERAMDSVTAQWQRFQNIVGEGIAESAQGMMAVVKDLLMQISDRMIEMRRLAEQKQARRDAGLERGYGGNVAQYAYEYDLRPAADAAVGAPLEYIGNMLWSGGAGTEGRYTAYGGLGTWLVTLGGDASKAETALRSLETQMQKQSETVAMHEDKVRSLDREIQRLITQERALNETQGAVSAETVTLASRFEGLSRHLLGATNDVQGLIGAMRNLRNEEAGLLVESIQGQVATANMQLLNNQKERRRIATELINNADFMRMLNQLEQAQLRLLGDPRTSPEARRTAAGILSDRQQIWTREGRTELVNQVTPLLTANQGAAEAEGTAQRGQRRIGDLQFQRSAVGADISARFGRVEAYLAEMRTADKARQQAILALINVELDPLEAALNRNMDMNGPHKADNAQAILQLNALRQGAKAILTPTKAETTAEERAERKAERERQAAERARLLEENQPRVNEADIRAIFTELFGAAVVGTSTRGGTGRQGAIVQAGRELIGQGFNVGENKYIGGANGREARPQYNARAHTSATHGDFAIDVNAIKGIDYNDPAAKTKLDKIARDYQARGYRVLWGGRFWEPYGNGPGGSIAARNVERRKQGKPNIGLHMDHLHMEAPPEMANRGGNQIGYNIGKKTPEEGARAARQLENALRQRGIQGNVTYQNGKLRVQLPEGARYAAGADRDGSLREGQVDLSTHRLATRNANADLTQRTKELKYALTEESFKAGEDAIRVSFESWANALRDQSEEALANEGNVSAAAATLRRAEIEDQITQRREEMENNIFDAILKNTKEQMEAAELAFTRALRPAQDKIAQAEAELSGFGYFSNRGQIPDYVQQLAENRVSRAQEDLARSRMSQLPNRIQVEEGLRADLQNQLTTRTNLTAGQRESLTEQIDRLTDSIAALRAEKIALDASFAAGGLVPTSISDGLNQAITAYREAHVLTRSFKEELVHNLGGALTTVHEGIATMFTDIMTGSKTVLQAFGDFVQGMIQFMIQLAARALATQIFNMLLTFAAAYVGGSAPSGMGATSGGGAAVGMYGGGTNLNGSPVQADGLVHLARGGGRVTNGSRHKDSVNAKIAKDEWVVNGDAVRSVGHGFMAKLNAYGASAIESMRAAPTISMANQEVNVWVTRPDIPRQLGKNDILVAVHEDILQNGETKKLIKYVQQSG